MRFLVVVFGSSRRSGERRTHAQVQVTQVSADRLTDNRTGNPYYNAYVTISEEDLAALPNIKLYPGMPAIVMIQTVERTAFEYLIGPLAMSFNRAFRQK
jgi:membrane fusion protein, type I secretion system